MGTATGEQKRAASANGRQSTENRIQCPGRAEKEVNRQRKGFFWPKKGKMLFLCQTQFLNVYLNSPFSVNSVREAGANAFWILDGRMVDGDVPEESNWPELRFSYNNSFQMNLFSLTNFNN